MANPCVCENSKQCLWAGIYDRADKSQQSSLPNYQGNVAPGGMQFPFAAARHQVATKLRENPPFFRFFRPVAAASGANAHLQQLYCRKSQKCRLAAAAVNILEKE